MASCSDILSAANKLKDDNLRRLQDQLYIVGQRASSLGPLTSTAADASSTAQQAQSLISNAQSLSAETNNLYKQAKAAQCSNETIQAILDVGSLFDTVALNAELSLDDANKAIARFAAEEKKAQAATTTQNNAGNGTPGSAGTATTDQLTGVTVTGRKVPETTTDPSKAATDPLAEVKVTGKKVPETTTDPSKGNPLGAGVLAPGSKLDPVTGRAIPANDDLKEVQISSTKKGLTGQVDEARSQAAQSDALNWATKGDWRVRLSLAPGATYLYKAKEPGILGPLAATDGVIFPYTPSIQVAYQANYDAASIQHSNYKIFQYQNSGIENITIGCDFTAQSTSEANYVLAVIHFFRSVTKMFYGRDTNPIRGTPPPLCYLTGLGQYQFNLHPLVITSFSYNLPTDVDYIRAVLPASFSVNGNSTADTPKNVGTNLQEDRRNSSPTPAGTNGNPNPAALTPNGSPGSTQPTYVPTKINIQITAYPMIARNVISNDFSLQQYATGALLLGKNNSSKGGIW